MAFRSCGSVICCPFSASQVVVSRLSLMALLIWMYCGGIVNGALMNSPLSSISCFCSSGGSVILRVIVSFSVPLPILCGANPWLVFSLGVRYMKWCGGFGWYCFSSSSHSECWGFRPCFIIDFRLFLCVVWYSVVRCSCSFDSMSVLYALVLQCMLRLSMLLPYDNVAVLFL